MTNELRKMKDTDLVSRFRMCHVGLALGLKPTPSDLSPTQLWQELDRRLSERRLLAAEVEAGRDKERAGTSGSDLDFFNANATLKAARKAVDDAGIVPAEVAKG